VGSLIVQSVLENWNETAKADVVEELLADIYSCAVQQWGVSDKSLLAMWDQFSNHASHVCAELCDSPFNRAFYWCHSEKTV
jgi:hypothetical protein